MTADPSDLLRAEVLSVARACGLDEVGVCDASPFDAERRVLEQRRDEGLHGGMAFTYRNPARSTDPSATLPGARSMIVGALRYDTAVPPPPAVAAARVARYATADHYSQLRLALEAVRATLRDAGHRAIVVADDNAMVDRAVAVRAGIGWAGKNSNVLLPGRGSWFVLGSVITDAELTPTGAPIPDGCGSCRRCLDGCPTGAIVAPGVVDARRCLAWHVQAPGDFPREFRSALGNRIYGCDDCQEVCPPSRRGAPSEVEVSAVEPARGADGAWVDLQWLLSADDAELMDGVGRWYVPRRDPRYVRRNALVVLGNTGRGDEPWVREALERHLVSGDDLLAGHAAWAALSLGLRDWLLAGPWADREAVVSEIRSQALDRGAAHGNDPRRPSGEAPDVPPAAPRGDDVPG
jgi:epoxyqueuosine reductase